MDSAASTTFLCAAFPRLYERFHRRIPADGYKPSPESLAVLRHLQGSGPLTVGEAQRHFARSQSAISEIFRRLEERGLLTRLADVRDRRRTLVWLSEAGQAELAAAESVLDPTLVRPALAALDPATVAGLLRGLEALLDTAPTRPVPDSRRDEP